MRILDYVSTAIKDIATQPLRCLLTVSAVALSSALLVSLVSLGITTRSAIVGHFERGDAMNTIVISANSATSGLFSSTVQETRSSSEKITDDTVERVKKIPGVSSANPQVSIWELRNFKLKDTQASYVADVVATSDRSLQTNALAAGQWFNNDETTAKVVLGNGYLQALGFSEPQQAIGKELSFESVRGYRGLGADIPSWSANSQQRTDFDQTKTTLTATIIGVLSPSVTDTRIYVPLEWGRLVSSPRVSTPNGETKTDTIARNGYSTIVAIAESKDEVGTIAARINELGFGAITYQKQIEQINQLSTVMWMILGAIALISLIGASLGIVNTLLMSVSEQKQTIQIWRACGASRALVARLYVLQAIILSIIGASLGAAVGYLACTLINTRIESVLSAQGLTSLTLPETPLWVILGSITVSVIIAMLAAAYPARVAARKIID